MAIPKQNNIIVNRPEPSVNRLVKKIALGTVQFGLDYGISNQSGKTSEKEVVNLLNLAKSYGISLLDTAQAYGSSEEVIGRNHHERFDIVTKINPNLKQTSSKKLVEESLNRLELSAIYGVLFHSAESAFSNPKAYQDLQSLKSEGRIKKIGFSVYKPEELELLIDTFGQPDLVQLPFSHLDRRFEKLLIDLHESGVEIHTRSTFLQGLFFMNPEKLSPFFQPVKEYLKLLKNEFSNSKELAGFLLSYVVSRPFIDKVVLGVNNTQQLEENLSSLTTSFEPIELNVPEIQEDILLPYLWK
ncbi:MAG: aryl-alcohol dehydrogenase-like predicted oxidoreductase [Halieaceae bacterium]|jgi:aryl-alcohol dehydrogenase-like predicted oxidoreductase